jgi:hypothetical protein
LALSAYPVEVTVKMLGRSTEYTKMSIEIIKDGLNILIQQLQAGNEGGGISWNCFFVVGI